MLSKPVIQFSIYGCSSVPSLLFTWGQTMVEIMKIVATSFKRSHACTATLSAPSSAAGHHLLQPTTEPHLHWRLLETPGKVWVSVLRGPCSFLLGPGAHKFLFMPSKSHFLVLCKFWQLYGGVTGDLLQEGLCHVQVCCCTQSPCPCGSPLLTCTSTGDTQTQF